MVKTKELCEDIQSSIISTVRPLKGIKCTAKDIGISHVREGYKRVTKPRTVKNLRGRERKTIKLYL